MKAKKKIIRWSIRIGLLLALPFLILWLFLWWRELPDYSGDLAALLPAHASAYVIVRDLSGMATDFKKTDLYQQFVEDDDLLALIMSDKKHQKYLEEKGTVESKLKEKLIDRFIHRYFGRSAALAVVRFTPESTPALLMIAQTRLGFHERVAEFCAELFPELKLEKVKHGEATIYLYRGEKSKRSFSYFRYGQTVVLSLRSEELDPLKNLIDFREAGSPDSLADFPPFIDSLGRVEQPRGAIAYLNPENLADDLRDLMGDRFEKRMGKVQYRLLRRLLENHETANLSVNYDGQLIARLELHNRLGDEAESAEAIKAKLFSTSPPRTSKPATTATSSTLDSSVFVMAPRDAPIVLAADSASFVRMLSDAPNWLSSETDDEDRQWATDLLTNLLLSRLGSVELLKNIETLLGRDALIVFEGLKVGLLFPTLHITCVSQRTLDADQEAALAEMLDLRGEVQERARSIGGGYRQWPLLSHKGAQLLIPLYVTQGEERIFFSTDADGHHRLLNSEWFPSRALTENPIFQRAWGGEQAGDTLALFANLEELAGHLARLRNQRILGQQLFQDEEKLAEFDRWLRIMPNLQGMLLRVQAPENTLRLELTVLVR